MGERNSEQLLLTLEQMLTGSVELEQSARRTVFFEITRRSAATTSLGNYKVSESMTLPLAHETHENTGPLTFEQLYLKIHPERFS